MSNSSSKGTALITGASRGHRSCLCRPSRKTVETNGHVLRPYAAVCCHSLALPSSRPATGIKREGRDNWREMYK